MNVSGNPHSIFLVFNGLWIAVSTWLPYLPWSCVFVLWTHITKYNYAVPRSTTECSNSICLLCTLSPSFTKERKPITYLQDWQKRKKKSDGKCSNVFGYVSVVMQASNPSYYLHINDAVQGHCFFLHFKKKKITAKPFQMKCLKTWRNNLEHAGKCSHLWLRESPSASQYCNKQNW